MRLIFVVFLMSLALVGIGVLKWMLAADAPLKNKPAPVYKTVDPALQPLVDDYKSLAEQNNIKFTHNVSIGFMKIDHKEVVGLCNYGKDFREIDIDQEYFNKITYLQKKELVFHELTHCYCSRKHDFGEDKPYPEAESKIIKKDYKKFRTIFWVSPGFFIDGCPTSIMYPYVLSNSCFERHEEHYNKEMFDRCEPY